MTNHDQSTTLGDWGSRVRISALRPNFQASSTVDCPAAPGADHPFPNLFQNPFARGSRMSVTRYPLAWPTGWPLGKAVSACAGLWRCPEGNATPAGVVRGPVGITVQGLRSTDRGGRNAFAFQDAPLSLSSHPVLFGGPPKVLPEVCRRSGPRQAVVLARNPLIPIRSLHRVRRLAA
jgi:hypothetical protein